MATALPKPGQIIKLRQRLYLVDEVIAATTAGEDSLVSASCVDDDAQGQPLQVLWEREIAPEILNKEAWDRIAERGFDKPKLFAAYLNTLSWNCVTSTDPDLFQAPFRAGIKLEPYQLEPLRMALRLPRVNLFIADDVGLGKTIEAGLIARELLLRKKARDIVVSCPPSMLQQWKDELEARFGLTFQILDKSYMQRVRRQRGFGVNPWNTHSKFLISHRLLIDEGYSNTLVDWLGDFRPGSLLILDEAHHAAPSSGQKYAIDSQFTHCIRDIAYRFEHRLFLSATPHNGHRNSFSALLEILDPQRFCRGVPVTPKVRDQVMVRRLKEDLRAIDYEFPERRIEQIDVDDLSSEAPELVLADLLSQYRELREARMSGESRRIQSTANLIFINLQQRLLSSTAAFARTLSVHSKKVRADLAALGEMPAVQPSQLDLLANPVGADDERAALPEEELAGEEDAQAETATAILNSVARPVAEELTILDRMIDLAQSSKHLPDGRIVKLLAWMRSEMCPGIALPKKEPVLGAKWSDTRVIIFTEYEDTRRYLQQQLSAAICGTDRDEERIRVYTGPTSSLDRETIKRDFNLPPSETALRILICTDAAREGLNLQGHCHDLFHFDVPWNPSRLEQRNGRIDRKLQRHPFVSCRYFVYGQRPEDRVLKALIEKTKVIKQELGSLSPVIESRLVKTMEGGIRRGRLAEQERAIVGADLDVDKKAAIASELEGARKRKVDLLEERDTIRKLIDRSQKQLNFRTEAFQQTLSCALELMGAEPLTPSTSGARHFSFPNLDQRAGADPSWSYTLDTLRRPRDLGQKMWDWRNTTPVREIVFEDTGSVDGEFVHLHLEHAVVRRLLGRFSAQGFIHHDLSRACLAQTRDAKPRVILLGRLCLYGGNAARLHEELVPVTAEWKEPEIRKGTLKAFAREKQGETKTLALLHEGLNDIRENIMSAAQERALQACAPRDIAELLPELTSRAEEFAREALQLLEKRAEAEASAMVTILTDQRSLIIKQKKASLNYEFDFDNEKKQLESNQRYWDSRLQSIERELTAEPSRIRDLYSITAKRIEPVGLIYLWPVSG